MSKTRLSEPAPLHLKLPLPDIFNYQACYRFIDRGYDECLQHTDGEKVSKWLPHCGAVVEVANGRHHLALTVYEDGKTQLNQPCVEKYMHSWFDLDTNLNDFYAMAASQPVLAPLTRSFYGLRMIGIPDLFEGLCWSVIGQQINLTFAYMLKRALVEQFGLAHTHAGVRYLAMPMPQTLAGLSVADLTPYKFSRRKAEYLIGLGEAFATDRLNQQRLSELHFDEAVAALVAIRGIGPWTAHYVLMKCLRHRQAFPAADAGLLNALKQRMGLAEKPSADTVAQLGKKWEGWQAYATLYLWQSLAAK